MLRRATASYSLRRIATLTSERVSRLPAKKRTHSWPGALRFNLRTRVRRQIRDNTETLINWKTRTAVVNARTADSIALVCTTAVRWPVANDG